jgi:hypothetical protein
MDKRRSRHVAAVKRLLPTVLVFALLSGCRSTPTITLVKIPPAGPGGSLVSDDISGKVVGARPGQHIIIFAETDVWWFQSGDDKSYAEIQPDGSWSKSIHLGRQYAVMLVDSTYRPPPTATELPAAGGEIVAVARVKGLGSIGDSSPSKPTYIDFSGYHWNVRAIDGEHGGISHPYDPSNVSVDEKGILHLRLTKRADTWACSEVELPRSLGYGTYLLQVKDTASFEPATQLSFFTWGELGSYSDHHEIYIDLSQRGNPQNKNAEYAVQPYYLPMNMSDFNVPAGAITYSFDWEPEGISFASWRGTEKMEPSNSIWKRVFRSDVRVPGGETVHINLCVFGFPKVPQQHEAEVLIKHFEFLP